MAGNQRYKAAKAIGMTEVPTILLEGLTEQREKEIIIRDNVENGDWDMDILANEWEADALKSWGVEGVQKWDEVDFENFLQDTAEKEEDKNKKEVVCPNCGTKFEA